jgi:hypothetical protein
LNLYFHNRVHVDKKVPLLLSKNSQILIKKVTFLLRQPNYKDEAFTPSVLSPFIIFLAIIKENFQLINQNAAWFRDILCNDQHRFFETQN